MLALHCLCCPARPLLAVRGRFLISLPPRAGVGAVLTWVCGCCANRGEEDPEWLQLDGPAPPRRTSLPKPRKAEKSVSLWSIIKECVGKDLSRVCLPVYFNEPFSALQRIAEELEYSHLLDKVGSWPGGVKLPLMGEAAGSQQL